MPVPKVRVARWFLPGGAVATVAAYLVFGPSRTGLADLMVDRYGSLVFGAAAVLAAVFHRSRVVGLVLAIVVVDAALRFGHIPAQARPAVALLLAGILGVGALARDRGVTSRPGLVQVLAAPGASVLAVFAVRMRPDALAALSPAAEPTGWMEGATGFGAGAVGLVGLAAMLVAFGCYLRRGPVERSLVWALALVVAMAHPALGPGEAGLMAAAAALSLGLGVIETSYAMAYRDELTGLPGRRSLMRDLDALPGTYTLAMVDVDHFKRFNDRHGHDVGDQVLRLVATRLARVAGGGRAYRYGGEEFTILFRGSSREEVEPHLEAVRASVAAARFSLRRWTRPSRGGGRPGRAGRKGAGGEGPSPRTRSGGDRRALSVTVSIGVADDRSASEGGPGAVLKKADQALYRAKKGGRNQVSR